MDYSPALAIPTFDIVLQRIQAGRLADAAQLCAAWLEACPGSAEARHGLGLVHMQQGNARAAMNVLREAASLAPDDALLQFNLGCVSEAAGAAMPALAAYRRAAILQPASVTVLNNLAALCLTLSQLDEAARVLEAALRLAPGAAALRNNAGLLQLQRGQFEAAAAQFRLAVTSDPENLPAWRNLGLALLRAGHFAEALAALDAALRLAPQDPSLLINRGLALTELGRGGEAVLTHRRALALDPENFAAHFNLGVALRLEERAAEAVPAYRAALALRPGDADTLNNLGIAEADLGRLPQAEAHFREAIAGTDHPDAHFNLGTTLLARGELAEGWREFEWRWRTRQLAGCAPHLSQPRWDGKPAPGKTLLIHAEQGFGDTLQFCRYAPMAAARGLRVVLSVPEPLRRLCAGLPGVAQVVTTEAPPPFDLHCPMMSLPLAFGTTLATIPGPAAYLQPPLPLVAGFARRLAALSGPRVGLVWSGNPRRESLRAAATDRRRSIAPARLKPLLDVPGLHVFSLQKDGPGAPPGAKLHDWMAEMGDFADTAALIANLDLVISVDTAVAHLAAALGRPVWLLNRFDSCWRWLRGRRDSPWYPSLRLYTQPAPGAWDEVIAAVAGDLRDWAALHPAAQPAENFI